MMILPSGSIEQVCRQSTNLNNPQLAVAVLSLAQHAVFRSKGPHVGSPRADACAFACAAWGTMGSSHFRGLMGRVSITFSGFKSV